MRAVLTAAPVRVAVFDRTGRVLLDPDPNPSIASDRGVPAGGDFFELHPDTPGVRDAVQAAFSGRESRITRIVDDATHVVTFIPRRGPSGAVENVIAVATVVAAGAAIEEALRGLRVREREAESNLARVLETLPIVLWSVDAGGKLTLSAGSGLRALGLESGQIVGQSLFELYAHHPTAMDGVRRALRGEQCTVESQERGLILESVFMPLRDEAGGVTGVLGITIDVTERRRAEAEQERLRAQMLHVQKLESLGLLAGGIAHDFNNVLAAIVGGASAALLTMPPDTRAREHIEGVIDSAQRAASLTRQMLAYAGKGQVEIRPLDLSRYVLELSPLLEASIPKTVQLQFELQTGLPEILVDVAQIQQVAMNLVINAAEAIGEQTGTVRVLTRARFIDEMEANTLLSVPGRAGQYVVLEVQDTGHGMDEATRSKIFDPFFSTKFTGRGLGLAAVHGIVRAHRGGIHLDSTPGHGTSFQVLFPVTDVSGVDELLADATDFRGHGLALIVDDDRAVRKITARLMELFGFTVIEARDGQAGLDAFVRHAGDIVVVLLDMTMPMMGGEQTLRALRQVRADVPILVMSGYDASEMSPGVTSSGVDGFLAKPFTSDVLARKLKAALAPR
jgi:two-component system, cell cycle sensor histidine kinase and response regulator CckA